MSRIASIKRMKISDQRLYNLAVEQDESFIADGIVVHNCKSYIMPILAGNLGNRETEDLKPSRASLDKYVTLADQQKTKPK